MKKKLFKVFVGFFFLVLTNSFALQAATSVVELPSPQVHCRFEKTASPSENNGIPAYRITGKVEYVAGLQGNAVHFPQTNTAESNANYGFILPLDGKFFAKPFSISFWVFMDEEWERTTFSDFFSLGGENGPGFRLSLYYGALRLMTGNGQKSISVGPSEMVTSLYREKWTHLALVYDGKEAAFYRDGELLLAKPIQLTEGEGQLTVGSLRNGSAYPMQGAMDEVRIYDLALTAGQVTALYLAELQ